MRLYPSFPLFQYRVALLFCDFDTPLAPLDVLGHCETTVAYLRPDKGGFNT